MAYDSTKDATFGHSTGVSGPARQLRAVTPHDTNDLALYARSLYVGGAGDLRVIAVGDADDAPQTLVGFSGLLPVQVRRVLATGTTATAIVALI
jgi:hypothetical protein